MGTATCGGSDGGRNRTKTKSLPLVGGASIVTHQMSSYLCVPHNLQPSVALGHFEVRFIQSSVK